MGSDRYRFIGKVVYLTDHLDGHFSERIHLRRLQKIEIIVLRFVRAVKREPIQHVGR